MQQLSLFPDLVDIRGAHAGQRRLTEARGLIGLLKTLERNAGRVSKGRHQGAA